MKAKQWLFVTAWFLIIAATVAACHYYCTFPETSIGIFFGEVVLFCLTGVMLNIGESTPDIDIYDLSDMD